jgi:hypothetical protein
MDLQKNHELQKATAGIGDALKKFLSATVKPKGAKVNLGDADETGHSICGNLCSYTKANGIHNITRPRRGDHKKWLVQRFRRTLLT